MYTWKTYKELKNRVLRNKTQMLYDHLITSGSILLGKMKKLSYTPSLENEYLAKLAGEDFDAKNFERE